jgi:hypothetical protein
MTAETNIKLKCHPSSCSKAVHSIRVRLQRSVNGELQINYRVEADISRILVQASSHPRISARLWEHTCFEAFVAAQGRPGYHEFNFAPSCEWAIFAFRGYRDGAIVTDEMMRPRIAVTSDRCSLALSAVISLDQLSDFHPRAVLNLGLSAVIEANDGKSYWALRHPAGTPDFHAMEGFALVLEPPASART